MSVKALNQKILAAKADGNISLAEARDLLKPHDSLFSKPKGIGDFVDKYEHKALKDLIGEMKSGNLQSDPRALSTLQKQVNKGPDSRGKHILKTIFGARAGSIAGSVPGFLGGGMVAFAIVWGTAFGGALATLGVWAGVTALGGLTGASMGGTIHGLLDD